MQEAMNIFSGESDFGSRKLKVVFGHGSKQGLRWDKAV